MREEIPWRAARHPWVTGPDVRLRNGVLLVAAAWLLLAGGDWYYRFTWFRWQDRIRLQPAPAPGAAVRPAVSVPVPASRGGDLTRLVGIPSFNQRYERERPARLEHIDEFGYRNPPPVIGVDFPVVVVGDSYMFAGATMTNTFSARLSAVSGRPVYNHARAGIGPFIAISQFFREPRFREHPPRVLVWGFIEREVAGDVFSGLSYWLRFDPDEKKRQEYRGSIVWSEFRPRRLKTQLPNTSAAAQLAARWWRHVRFLAWGRIPPEVLAGHDPASGTPLLFYREAIDAMKWPPEVRKIDKVAFHIEDVNHFCVERGMELAVILIPDKEQVYREQLPPEARAPGEVFAPSCLPELEARLREKGIRVVNLLEPFRAQAAAGQLLYWPDDTHWNSDGIQLAAELAWREISDIFTR
jgi:hypothetical protein